jgi:hypothetical protein
MPSEHTIIFVSAILELLVLLFVAYEVIMGEIRHRRAEVTKDSEKPAPPPRRRPMSIRLGSFIAFVSLVIWLVLYATYSNGTFLSFNGREPDTGPIVWNFEQTTRGAGFFLTMQKIAGEQEIRVVTFGAKGKNKTDQPISKFSGYLRSEQTNVTIPIYLLAQESDQSAISKVIACFPHPWIPTIATETFGIPPFAEFEISTWEKPFIETGKDGVPLSKFIRDFVPFTVVLEYDGTKYERRFTLAEVQLQATMLDHISDPTSAPHIVRRPNAKAPPPLPLQTLLPADLPKTPPGLVSPLPMPTPPNFPNPN